MLFGGSQVGNTGSLELSVLDGTNGFVMHGVSNEDRSGRSVSAAGDINNDGINDLIIGAIGAIGAHGADPGGRSAAGSTYVVFGGSQVGNTGSLELGVLDGTNGFVMHGVSSWDESGYSVSAAGDINNDGIDDLIIGAPYASPGGRDAAGSTYVVFGRNSSALSPTHKRTVTHSPPQTTSLTDVTTTLPEMATTSLLMPRILRAALILTHSETLILGNEHFLAESDTVLPNELHWIIGEGQSGQFERVNQPGEAITEFTQAEVNQGMIQFVHDGSNQAPSVSVSVFDGQLHTPVQSAQVHFAGLPALLVNQLQVDIGGQVTLSENELSADTNLTSPELIVFTVHDVQHGRFIESSNPAESINQFSQAQVLAGEIVFVADGSRNTPYYSTTVSLVTQPTITSASESAQTTLCDNQECSPWLLRNGLYVEEGRATVLSLEDMQAYDPEGFHDRVTFVVREVAYGRFTYTDDINLEIPSFTQSEIAQGRIQFEHDGSEARPKYEVQVGDGWLESAVYPGRVVFRWLNDAPMVIQSIPDYTTQTNEAFTFYIPTETFSDPDNAREELTFSAELAGGHALPAGLAFDAVTQQFSGQLSEAGVYDIAVTVRDVAGLNATSQFALRVTAPAPEPTQGGTSFLGGYIGLGTLVSASVTAGLFAYRNHKNRKHRQTHPLANALRRELQLDISNFDSHEGRDYVDVVNGLIDRLNQHHDNFYSHITKQVGRMDGLVQCVAQAVREQGITINRAGWGWCAHCRGLRHMDLSDFRNHVNEIAQTTVAVYRQHQQTTEIQLTGRGSEHERAASAAWRASDAGETGEVIPPPPPLPEELMHSDHGGRLIH